MADLFPVFMTDGSRADTIIVMSPRDFVFFCVRPERPLRAFCEQNPHVGYLTDIALAINAELDARRDLIFESLIRHGECVNEKFAKASLAEQQVWAQSWVGVRLGRWYFTKWAQHHKNDIFGVALADLPQVLLSGMGQDFRLELRSYTDLLYQQEYGPLALRREADATRRERDGEYRVEAADYSDGRSSTSEALGGQGNQDRVDLDSGEVCSTVRECGQASDQAGQDPEAGQGRSEELPGGSSGTVCPPAPAEPISSEA